MLTRAFALLFSLLVAPAFAQVTPGTSPLSIPKGGTGGATAAAARSSLGVTATGADTTYNFRSNNLSDVASAPTARTNLGLAIGSNVQAWDNDLDCVAALATTGLIKRTGTGTCSAGSAALSDLATGTQDTVIGYFGSTTASAVAISNCTGGLTYSTTTHTFGCNVGAGTGTVTSAQISAGNGVSVATTAGANPCTTTCNLTVTNTGVVKVQPAQKVTASGTYTPTTGMIYVQVECVGGGGGGGGLATSTASGMSGGGGSGAYSRVILTAAQIGASKAITIGAGGTQGSAGANNGSAGGDTSLGVLCVAKGGSGGGGTTAPNQTTGGAGGLASGGTGDVKINGNSGPAGSGSSVTTVNWVSGPGAGSYFGGGAAGSSAGGLNGTDCGGGGSGGAGNATGNLPGGTGAAGCVVITEYTNQ